ncbi:hypothetical protein WDU94_013733 [Cyamophila willieti]
MIDKAVQMDKLKPVDSSVKHSSSAVDTVAICYAIKTFWKELAWPDVEDCFTLITRIVADICQSCIYYADRMRKKLDLFSRVLNVFQVTPEWCYAMNNIDYVRRSIEPLVHELEVAKIVQKLAALHGDKRVTKYQNCELTIQIVVEDNNDTMSNKLVDLISNAINKMLPVIERLLLQGIELEMNNKSLDELMIYLDTSLLTMRNEMDSDNFKRVLDIIWDTVLSKMKDITRLGVNQPPQYYKHVLNIFDVLVEYFKESKEAIDEFRQSLELYSLSTNELIHMYYLEQCQTIQSNGGDCGQLTIRAMILKNQGLLKIEILNCRNLKPNGSDKCCNPFVRFKFVPENKFLDISNSKHRTKDQKKTFFPLFDETFQISLTNDQMNLKMP